MTDETKKAVDEFLSDLRTEEEIQDPFQKTQDEVVLEEQPKGEDENDKEEKPLPFHKDPKIQRYIDKEIAKRIPEQPSSEVKDDNTTDIDEVLTRIIGNDTPEKVSAIKDFKRVILEREDRGAQKAIDQWQAQREAESQEEQQAEETLLQGFEAIEEGYNVDITSASPQAKKLRGQFIDFVKQVAPKDEDGEIKDYPDLEETFKVFQQTRQGRQSNSRAKDLADRSLERGGSSESPKTDERITFDNVDRIFDKLAG